MAAPGMEPERYELDERPAHAFALDRRELFRVLGGGVAIALVVRGDAHAQESGRGRRGNQMPRQVAAWLHIDAAGAVTVYTGKVEVGQNIRTSLTQAVCEELRVPTEDVELVMGDTDRVPFGRGTFAARSSMIGGCALKAAAEAIVEKAKPVAAHLMEATPADVEFAHGSFRIAGTDRSIPLMEVAGAFYGKTGIPSRFGLGLEASGSYAMDAPSHPANYPNGCHCCEVEIDPETGVVRIDRYTVVDDVGRVINPMICEGQVQGGLAQGIGQALLENVIYDPDTAQLLSGTWLDYTMPHAAQLPSFELYFRETPTAANPLGVKGSGQAGCMAAPQTIMSAVLDALKPMGITDMDMPATPERLWRAIKAASP